MRNRKVPQIMVELRFQFLNLGTTFNNNGNIVFKMFGRYWCTNKNRKIMYKMDDIYWMPTDISLLSKLNLILFRKVKGFKVNVKNS